MNCDMKADCTDPVTHIDDKGFVYCNLHGIQRTTVRRCRRLKAFEIAQLSRGEVVAKF